MKWCKLCKSKEDGDIGFRDLHAFNLALLAKQEWRLSHNSESLFYRVFKEKYFPTRSFLNAKIGSNLSFIWRSFLGAEDIVREWSKWKVGNGPSIKVWEDNWLPHPPIRKQNAVEVLKVNELIVKYTNSWNNKGLIDSIFEENTALCGGLALTV